MIRKYRYGAPFDTEAVTEKIETANGAFPYGKISLEKGFDFTYVMDEDDIVYGLGEANRGINKRGYCYISNCTDDPNHTEDKRSLYGAHNFIIVSGKTTFGLFFDYPSELTFDIGYTRMDTLKVSCENADLDIYVIEGENAYGFLKSEAGVHRLVRVSPFDSAGRRHTSFSSLEVMPEIDEDLSVEINPDDIKMEVYRASGAGGQKVNKTSSAVRLIHIPTGIVVSCQVERSQYQNRDVAMKMLISKLVEIKEREHLEKISDIKGEQKEITWGSQIRSYVFMPYTLVKDHRTGCEKGNISAVMDGDLDDFITAYLKALSQGTLGENIE